MNSVKSFGAIGDGVHDDTAAIISSGDQWISGDPDGVFFSAGIYATIAGAGAEASFEYEC
jgi:hypothetical protein